MFKKCQCIARDLNEKHPEVQIEILEFFETQWMFYMKKVSNEHKGVFYDHDVKHPLVTLNHKQYIGDADQFSKWALFNFNFIEREGLSYYKDETSKHLKSIFENNHYYFMNFCFEENKAEVSEKVVFELFHRWAPKTSENFMKLCEGHARKSDNKTVSYVGTEVHRIVRGMYL
jgi:hypothetical protein